MLWMIILAAQFWLASQCVGQETPRADATNAAYLRDINQAREDLDAGKIADVGNRLDATDKSFRSFEFEYLKSRLQGVPATGGAAPDLISKLATPKVETRYGVLNPVSRQVAFICRDGGLRIHDLNSLDKEPRHEKHPQNSTVWSGVFSHDGKVFFSGHENGDVLVWDSTAWKIRQTVSIEKNWTVRELAASPDGTAFVAESKTDLQLWSLKEEQPKKVASVGERYTFGEGLTFSPIGDMVATGGMFDIILYDAKTGNPLRSMRHASYTMGLEFSPDGKRIASAPRGNVNKFLAVFDVTQDQPLFNAGPFGNYIAGMSFSPDGKRIAATGCENEVRIFDATTGSVVLTFKRTECSSKPAFTKDGRLLGWNEPDGFRFIELGRLPAITEQKSN